jgi:iron complex transport system ATP-binding protein
VNSGLAVDGLTARVEGHVLLDNVSFRAPPSQITGLVGPNGAGKSTLMRSLLGLADVQGSATYNGRDLLKMPRRERSRIAALVEQSSATQERPTVKDVVSLGRLPFQPLWQSSPSSIDEKHVDMALHEVGLGHMAQRLFNTLSGGEQQRVQLARALAQDPHLLVLDEPTSSLDIHAQLLAFDVVRRRSDAGATVIMSLHDLNAALAICDHLVVLDKGKVRASGPAGEVLSPTLLAEVYGVRGTMFINPSTGRPTISFEGRISD